ncbi:MAG: hypothetical protein GKR90_06255 [Pseudomonadales bacterium]|nr:hypothetical protein [Pseudomonadales bacterium]
MTSRTELDEPAKMSLEEQWDFVTGPLHDGAICKVTHYLSLPLLLWGAAGSSLWPFLIGLLLPTLGHLYDHIYRFDPVTRAHARQVVWIQILGGGIALLPFFFIYLAIQA